MLVRKNVSVCPPLISAIFFIIFLLSANDVRAQNGLKVFYDCSNSNCDFDYLKTELVTVNFVRNRFEADVYLMVTEQNNSIGSKQITLIVIGQNNFKNHEDTLQYSLQPKVSDDDKRKKLLEYTYIGLLPYMAKSNSLPILNFTYDKQMSSNLDSIAKKDKWNYWVFSISGVAQFNGSEVYNNQDWNGNLSADRETKKNRTNIWVSLQKQVQSYTDQGVKTTYQFQDYNVGASYGLKLKNHWAIGAESNYINSLYSNLKNKFDTKLRAEYNFYNYNKFNTHRLVLIYELAPNYNQYYDTTIYFKKHEFFVRNAIAMIGSFTQKWGSINAGIFWRNLFNDFNKNNLSFNGALSANVAKGLSFTIWGNYSFVRDQINLAKGDASLGDVLVKNKELLSAYTYQFGIGASYRFGSQNNNIVNPIFKGLSYSINL